MGIEVSLILFALGAVVVLAVWSSWGEVGGPQTLVEARTASRRRRVETERA